MPDRKGPGAKARKPVPGRPDREPRYLDISSGYVDTSRLERPAPPSPPRPGSAPARSAPPGPREVARSGLVDTSRWLPPAPREPEPPVMTRRQFEAEYQRLRREFGDSAENPGSFRCEGCRSCAICMFCQDCEGCYRCTHNGRGYPDTINPGNITTTIGNPDTRATEFQNDSQKVNSLTTATVGQRILLRISNVSLSDFHTLTVYGLPMTVVGKDARLLRGPDPDGTGPLLGKNLYLNTSSLTLGGGETADVIIDTTGVAPGTYFVYHARLKHLNNDQEEFGGAMTEIRISP